MIDIILGIVGLIALAVLFWVTTEWILDQLDDDDEYF